MGSGRPCSVAPPPAGRSGCRPCSPRTARVLDLLLPRTDAGVLAQVVAALIVFGGALAAVWRHPEFRVLVIGLGLTFFGFAGVRALH